MTSCFDFHTHSTASDGSLSPTAVVQRAHKNGVRWLALTDHDTTAGLAEAQDETAQLGMHLVPGIELSVEWEKQCFHIVGLNIDPGHAGLADGIRSHQILRESRAIEMGRRLEQKGVGGALAGARRLAGKGMITRTHFARFLVEQNYSCSMQKAFDQYLKRGRPGYVATHWIAMDQGVGWIRAAGGAAVLAHPMRYKITATRMRRFLTDFKNAGGQAIEVVCGQGDNNEIRNNANYAREFDLAASVGSDFHTPDATWIDIGRLKPLPGDLRPVWEQVGIESQSITYSSN